jgi:aminoglycoside phosphotransferase (APT) family kinase protein
VGARRTALPDPGIERVVARKLHDGEVDIDATLVRRLLVGQFPSLGDLALDAVRSTGTVNAIYRLGDDLCVRLPRVERWAGDLEKELAWLPKLAPHLSLAVPEPVANGEPAFGYPFVWAIYRWLTGDAFVPDRVVDEHQAAADLAQFVAELRSIDATDAPSSGRHPLRRLDSVTRAAIDALGGVVDTAAVTAAWGRCLHAPVWDGIPVWRHGDLLTPNLLVEDGRLKAVIDFGSVGAGDPASDVIAAWSVFGPRARDTFRSALDVDDGTWARARGYALHQALLIIPYYAETNRGFVATATRTVEHVLADLNA